jgi:predicted nucleotidyltransferase
MGSIVKHLEKQQLVRPPSWLADCVQYETLMGSVAYGVSSDTSDNDVYGFCIPPKDVVFPHLSGEIEGFGRQKQRFDQYQKHHIEDPQAAGGHGKQYDLSIYNIVRFFHLTMENHPNG